MCRSSEQISETANTKRIVKDSGRDERRRVFRTLKNIYDDILAKKVNTF